MTQVYDAAMIREKLETNDKWLARGIVAIYAKQTADEKLSKLTKHSNGVGFNGRDAEFLSSLASQIMTWEGTPKAERKWRQPLSEKQVNAARRKMLKYAGQLARIAEENNRVEDEVVECDPVQADLEAEAYDEMRAEAEAEDRAERVAIMGVEREGWNDELSW
jgi:hypothetical protein